MEELLERFHDSGERDFFPAIPRDNPLQLESRQEFFELNRIGVPIQRGLDDGSGGHEQIRVFQALLVVVLVEDNLVPGILDGLYDMTFFFLDTTLSKAMMRLS